jgi:hypothetical protein
VRQCAVLVTVAVCVARCGTGSRKQLHASHTSVIAVHMLTLQPGCHTLRHTDLQWQVQCTAQACDLQLALLTSYVYTIEA